MIDRIIGFSIKNKMVIGVFVLALIACGLYSLKRLPIDAVPDITNNQVQVITLSPTLAAQEIEQFITYPVELSMANIPDVVEIRSISRFGLSVVTIVFKDEVDIYLARQLVDQSINEASEEIPEGLGTPEMAPVTTGLGEIYQYVLHTKPGYEKKYSAMDLRTIQDWIVKRQLTGTPGVAEVSSFGGFVKEYEISIHPEKLIGMNTTIPEIFKALESNNENTGGAYIEKGNNAYFIRGLGLIRSLDDVKNIVVKNIDGVPMLIRDVAEVRFGSAVRYGAVTRNGEGEVVGGMVLMLKGENSSEVIERVKKRIVTIQKSLPEGVVLEPFLDRSTLVDRAINTVKNNLIEGGLIVILVLVLLLGNLRAGLVVASVIPLAMLFAISMMYVFGVSGNLMSLGAIDFGLVVDGAVIIVESIVFRIYHSTQLQTAQRLTQEEMNNVVYDAAVKIRKSAAFGEIIILIVYLPILTLTGIEGKMFKPMAQTVGFAIIGALILSLTYVPMMSALFLSKKTGHKRNFSDKLMDALQRRYDPVIHWAMRRKATVVIISVALFLVSIFLFSRMGGEFIPTLEEGDIATHQLLKPGSTLSQSVEVSAAIQKRLLEKFPEVKEVVTKIGSGEIPTDPMPIEAGDIVIVMKEKDEWTSAETKEEMFEKMEAELRKIPGVTYEFTQPIQMRFNELMTGVRSDIAIKIYGEDLDVLADKADEASRLIQSIPGVGDMRVEQVKGLPQIVVTHNRTKIAQYGLSIQDVNRVLNTAFAGGTAGVVFDGEKRFNLVVRLEPEHRKDLKDVRNLFIPLPGGGQIPLYEVANVEYKEGAMQISRDDTKRRITIGVNARDRDVESLVKEINTALDAKLKLPAGYYTTYGGQFENLQAAKERLMIAVPVALGLILALLYFTFNSMRQTLLIFSAIPMAAIGGVFALLLRDMPFSISAGVGFIALFGVAVLNGIVLIGYFNQLKSEGMTDLDERIYTGTRVRLRPVIMTAAVASLGFLPMAISSSAGAEVQKPLATVVIGGLITSTLLTLIVLPVLYSMFEKKNNGGNVKPGTIITAVIALLFMLPFAGQAQTNTPANMLTLDQAVKTALENNPGIKSASLQVDQQKALKGTSFDIDKTNISYQYGQFNSFENDDAISISQDIPFPATWGRNANLYRQQILASEYSLAMSKAELVRNVKLLYYGLSASVERLKLLQYQDSLYANFKRATSLKFETGETAYLEKLAGETRSLEVQNQLLQAQAEVNMYKEQLRKLVKVNGDFTVRGSNSYTLSALADTAALKNSPQLAWLKQQVAISEAETKVERSKLMPDLFIGYTNQSNREFSETTTGNDRYQFIEAGISIPLFFGAQRSRIQAAKIGQQVAASNYEQQKLQLETELQRLAQRYMTFKNSTTYYEQKGLNQANLMIQFADKSYSVGEIGYVEYLQSIYEALQIRLNYIEAVNMLNETAIQLDYMTGTTK
jgi:heavy metal efflux system protein